MDKLVQALVTEGVLKTPALIEAFRTIDRADFVSEDMKADAYLDTALPIGFEQTISQPYTVATMFELLAPRKGEKVLDVGSGSGWTTALLAHIVGEKGSVAGVEIIPELVAFGKKNLAKYAFPHASIRQAGEAFGLPKEAPFDRILVSAEAREVPEELVKQLRLGGVMVIPVGTALAKVTRVSEAKTDIERLEGFAFVPLVRRKGH